MGLMKEGNSLIMQRNHCGTKKELKNYFPIILTFFFPLSLKKVVKAAYARKYLIQGFNMHCAQLQWKNLFFCAMKEIHYTRNTVTDLKPFYTIGLHSSNSCPKLCSLLSANVKKQTLGEILS